MPRGRGRGRMRFRARPPASVRSSMQELGLVPGVNYSVDVSDATGAQVDAARAYFPALAGGPAPALRPTEKELELVVRFEKMRAALRASPAAVRPRTRRQPKLVGELARARAFFRAQPEAKKEEAESLWNEKRPWFVPELLPAELRGGARREAERKTEERKKQDIARLAGLDEEEVTGGDEGKKEAVEKEKEDGEGGAEMEQEGEDDLELDADYETGVRFDDDDGYEEADSGKEEPLF